MLLLKVVACVLLVTLSLAAEEDSGAYDPAKYEAPYATPETEEMTTETAEPVESEEPAESSGKPESEESSGQPEESDSRMQPVPAVAASLPAAVSPLDPSVAAMPAALPYPLLYSQHIAPFAHGIDALVSPQVAPFVPQQVAPFIYSAPQVFRIAAGAFPSVVA